MFKFAVLVNETDEVEVAIPQAMHHEVSKRYVGQIERMEFGFHFYETVKRVFPELHQRIMESIRCQLLMGNDGVYYSLCSDWFEDEAQ